MAFWYNFPSFSLNMFWNFVEKLSNRNSGSFPVAANGEYFSSWMVVMNVVEETHTFINTFHKEKHSLLTSSSFIKPLLSPGDRRKSKWCIPLSGRPYIKTLQSSIWMILLELCSNPKAFSETQGTVFSWKLPSHLQWQCQTCHSREQKGAGGFNLSNIPYWCLVKSVHGCTETMEGWQLSTVSPSFFSMFKVEIKGTSPR